MEHEKGLDRARRLETNSQPKGRRGGKAPRLMLNQRVKSNPRSGGGINRATQKGKGA